MKKVLIISLLAVLLLSAYGTVLAAYSYKVKLTADAEDYIPSGKATVGVSLSDINVGTSGISKLTGKIDYDKDVFEKIEKANLKPQNDWVIDSFDLTTGEFVASRSNFIKTDNEPFAIEFTVKSGATLGKTTITLKDIVISNGADDVPANNVTVSANIASTIDKDGNSNKVNTINIISNNTIKPVNTVNTINKINTANTTKNNAISNTMPKTGLEDYTAPLLLIAVLASGVAYISYKKYKNI